MGLTKVTNDVSLISRLVGADGTPRAYIDGSNNLVVVNGIISGGVPVSTIQNYVVVKSAADLPPALVGVRTFAANTVYLINASFSDSNSWVMSNNTRLLGVNGITETVTYTGTGTFIMGTDVRFAIDDIQIIGMTASALVAFNNTAADKVFTSYSTNYIGGAKGVVFNGCNIFRFDSCAFINQTSNCCELNGVIRTLAFTFNQFTNTGTSGICIDTANITAGSTEIFRVDTNQWVASHANHIFLNIANESFYTSVGVGQINNNIPQSNISSNFLAGGLTVRTSDRTEFINNPTILDSQCEITSYITTPAATTITDLVSYVALAGTWTVSDSSRMTHTNPSRFTYTGFPKVDINFAATIRLDVAAGTNRGYRIGLRKNGTTLVNHSFQSVVLDAGVPSNVPIIANLTDVSTNDYFEIVVQATTNIVNITATTATAFFMRH